MTGGTRTLKIKNAVDHLHQADHNEQARVEILRARDMRDWRVTMTFYAALHRIRAYFHISGIHVPSSHNEMRVKVARHMPEISIAYDRLFALSLKARYTDGAEIAAELEDEAAGLYDQVVSGMRRRLEGQGTADGRAD